MLSHFNRVCLFATLWTVACQAPLSTGFSRQEYWNGLPCPAPGDIPNPGIEPMSLTSPALAGGFFTTSATWKAWSYVSVCVCVLSVCVHAQCVHVHARSVAQSCLALCNPLDCSLPGSSVHGIFQARILEWVAISFYRGYSQPRDRTWLSGTAGRLYCLSHHGFHFP